MSLTIYQMEYSPICIPITAMLPDALRRARSQNSPKRSAVASDTPTVAYQFLTHFARSFSVPMVVPPVDHISKVGL